MTQTFKTFLAAAAAAVSLACGARVSVSGLEPANRIGGRMASSGYLRGKVVVIDSRDYLDKSNIEPLRRLQSVWSAYKTKPFVLIGCHTGAAKLKRVGAIVDKLGVTFPVYRGVKVDCGGQTPPDGKILVIDPTFSKVVYCGADERQVAGVVGPLILSLKVPSTPVQWKSYMDYELDNLPGRAALRIEAFLSDNTAVAEMDAKYPGASKEYREKLEALLKNRNVKKLSKLVEMSESFKDMDTSSKKGKKPSAQAIDDFIEKNKDLLESDDPNIVQEAKNAIADMRFSAAAIGGRTK